MKRSGNKTKRVGGRRPWGALAAVTSGPLILQSEGAEIFFRMIEVRKINAIPAEFAER